MLLILRPHSHLSRMLRMALSHGWIVALAGVWLLAASPAWAQTTWYVDDDAPNDPGPGDPTVSDPNENGSPEHPFDAIQEGIDAAVDGDTVLALDGTYTGEGNKDLDFGGRAITVRSENGPQACIIDCEESGRGFYFHSGEAETSVVEGLTITNGSADDGGGVYCDGSSPTLNNCLLMGNQASDDGGGVYCSSSSPSVTNCTFNGNWVDGYGAGMRNYQSSPVVTNCMFIANSAAECGGGMYNYRGSPTVANCTFSGNWTGWCGAGMRNYQSSLTVTNCTFTGNSTNDGGGGISNHPDSNTIVVNSILWGDIPDEIDGPALVTYSDVQGGWPGEGNLDVDPGFAFDDDPHLAAGSPCVDAGINDPPGGLPTNDLDGNPRPLDGDGDGTALADMGPYEFNPDAPSIAFSPQLVELFVSIGEPNAVASPLLVRNCGGSELYWEIATPGFWLDVDPSSGVSSGEIDEVSVIVDAGGVPHGSHQCELTISDPAAVNSPRLVPVTVHVAGTVSVPADYETIQAAIDATVPGDVVLIADGTYTGPGNKDLDFHGKAITVRSENGPQHCIIDCEGDGRGFYFHNGEDARSVVDGLTITNGNTGYVGGGMYNDESSPTVTNCAFTGNWAGEWGGGMYNSGSTPTVTNCTFTGNSAGVDGGGMYNVDSSPVVTNSTFMRNSAGRDGGGTYNRSDSTPTVVNCILWADAPNEICDADPNSTTSATYSDIQGGWPGEGNIDIDPGFAFQDDSHLLAGSACIDAGTNDPPGGLPTDDLDGNPRPLDGDGDATVLADMGAYEFNPDAPSIAFSPHLVELFVPEGEPNTVVSALFIRNCGGGELNWQIATRCPWLEVDPSSGVSGEDVDEVSVLVDPSGLPHASHTCELTISDPAAVNNPRAVPVTLHVNTTLHVPAEYDTIQAAIDATTVPGDVVLIADGIYTGPGNKDLDFRGKAITVRPENGPQHCVIDCEGHGRGFYFDSGEDARSVVDGLAITNGSAGDGAGAYCDRSSPTFRSCVFLDGRARYDGGGVYCWSSSAKVTNCAFLGNSAGSLGGAMQNRASRPTVTNCAFVGNSADNGGGMCNWHGSPTVANCMFLGNSAPVWQGGGMCNWDSSPTVTNCTFTGNSTNDGGGGGIANDSDSSTTMVNSILWGDTPNEIVGLALVTYSDVQGGWPGEGNLDVDPGFAFDDDPHLAAGSPCIDAGTNDPAGSLPTDDLDGNPRPLDGDGDGIALTDMGAYEFNADAPSIAFSPQSVELFVPEGEPNAVVSPAFIRNCGGGELNWQIATQCPWLEVDPSSGVSAGEVEEVSVIVDARGLPHASHTCELRISDPAAVNTPRTVPVTLHVNTTLSVPAEYETIQAAIDATVPGDVVLIADGFYAGSGNKDLDFRGKAITVRSENGPQRCTIDCQGSGRGFYFHTRENARSVVDGLTITNGNTRFSGGGIYCSSSSPTVTNCVLSGNSAGSSGGGMSNGGGSSPTVTSCAFIDNRAEYWAGGMSNSDSSPTVTNCTFTGNWANEIAGGMCNYWGRPTVINCAFNGNWAAYDGGGMWNVVRDLTVINCTFRENSCGDDGGGMYNSAAAGSATVTNCTFSGNSADEGGGMYNSSGSPAVTNCTFSGNSANEGGGMYNRSVSTPTVANCILWADAPDEICDEDPNLTTGATYSDIQGGWPGEGNIDADPLFVDPNNGDYRLSAGSPCIDRGDNTWVPPDVTTDLDGNPRLVDDPGMVDCGNGTAPIVDLGAYEFQDETCFGDLDGDDDIDLADLAKLLAHYGVTSGAVYPDGDLDRDGDVDLEDLAALLAVYRTTCE